MKHLLKLMTAYCFFSIALSASANETTTKAADIKCGSTTLEVLKQNTRPTKKDAVQAELNKSFFLAQAGAYNDTLKIMNTHMRATTDANVRAELFAVQDTVLTKIDDLLECVVALNDIISYAVRSEGFEKAQ